MSKICVCVLTENNFQDKTEEKGAEHSLGTVPLRGWGGVGGDMYRNVYLCACVIKQWNNAPLNLSQQMPTQEGEIRAYGAKTGKKKKVK